MTLQGALNNLESGTTSAKDVFQKLMDLECFEVGQGEHTCSCPVATYCKRMTGRKTVVTMDEIWLDDGVFPSESVPTPPNTRQFIRRYDNMDRTFRQLDKRGSRV